ncbi:MAG: DNA topoisomerase IB [Sandaracinaceae bacterium]|nr:MAG: DNA topoisomerase IB [Sandaracinaceae bacterium]
MRVVAARPGARTRARTDRAAARALLSPIDVKHDLAWARRTLDDDPRTSAEEAGLRYVDGEEPGYGRRKRGRGFSYLDLDGETVRSARLRGRFDRLVIPPAWTEVWICRDRRGHIQATGRDDAGRKQYIYHPDWRRARDRHKYDRVVAFGKVLPRIRRQVERDLDGGGLSRERVLASVVRLLETTLVRVGNDEYARKHEHYGLTTIRKKHVVRDGDEPEVVLDFTAKSGKNWRVEIDDPELVEIIVECLETPGYELFKYFDDDGRKRDVTSEDVNAYLREAAQARVTAKDFRTWAGTVLAAVALEEIERVDDEARHDRRLLRAIERVAKELGNTVAVCRSCYIHPEVLSPSEEDIASVAAAVRDRAQVKLRDELALLRPEEAAVLAYLEHRLDQRSRRVEPIRLAS